MLDGSRLAVDLSLDAFSQLSRTAYLLVGVITMLTVWGRENSTNVKKVLGLLDELKNIKR